MTWSNWLDHLTPSVSRLNCAICKDNQGSDENSETDRIAPIRLLARPCASRHDARPGAGSAISAASGFSIPAHGARCRSRHRSRQFRQSYGRFPKAFGFYRSQQSPGVIIVNTVERHLYLIQDSAHAIRYGIGVGREGFTWQGLLSISRKAQWPDWHPPPEMIERQPYLPRFMAGGPGNPLGARAMYLGNTAYRIHGTNAPETIGQAVSSGCFRLVNDDVTDLYDRVSVGTKVIVRQD